VSSLGGSVVDAFYLTRDGTPVPGPDRAEIENALMAIK
jgi:hypothetical protein